MQTYHVILKSDVFNSYRCKRAADSLDIDVEKKSIHELKIQCDIENEYNVGLIVGSSGSGKTTLCKQIFGDDCFDVKLDENKSIIDQLPDNLTYEQCAEMLSGIGLTSVPTWIRPIKTLSNGQKARCESVYLMTKNEKISIIDEWTSVVDRTVGKVMSHCVQKFARKNKKKIILCSCHNDVIEWLNPDWIIDCNRREFIDRRSLHPDERRRKEQLTFDIRETDSRTWKNFSKYHYLSENLPGGKVFFYGLFLGNDQIGFQCFANYVPIKNGMTPIFHSNRTVIHPDFAGFGLSMKFIDETSILMKKKIKCRIMGKFSSIPIFRSMSKNNKWKLLQIKRQIGKMNIGKGVRDSGYRENIKTYSFEFVG